MKKPESVSKLDVLLDGGAPHNVFYSRPYIPEGSKRKKVDLAHGTKQGYVKDGDTTFIDASVSAEEARNPAIG